MARVCMSLLLKTDRDAVKQRRSTFSFERQAPTILLNRKWQTAMRYRPIYSEDFDEMANASDRASFLPLEVGP